MPLAMTARTKGFGTVYFARPYDLKDGTLKNRLTFVRPTIFLGVRGAKLGQGRVQLSTERLETSA